MRVHKDRRGREPAIDTMEPHWGCSRSMMTIRLRLLASSCNKTKEDRAFISEWWNRYCLAKLVDNIIAFQTCETILKMSWQRSRCSHWGRWHERWRSDGSRRHWRTHNAAHGTYRNLFRGHKFNWQPLMSGYNGNDFGRDCNSKIDHSLVKYLSTQQRYWSLKVTRFHIPKADDLWLEWCCPLRL